MNRCKDCQRFYNLTVNARKVRKHGRQPKLAITKDEFLQWSRSQDRCCNYCGISEQDLAGMGVSSSIGLTVEALGIDRVDNDGDYTSSNIVFCCYACNKVKGNVFTTEEMKTIGTAIAEAWKRRREGVAAREAKVH